MIDNSTLAFWDAFEPKLTFQLDHVIRLDHPGLDSLILKIRLTADEYVQIASDWITRNGSMHEQFSRQDGSPIGARDLT